MSFKVIPIPETITKEVRSTMTSPQYSHPASVDIATGYGPCRACLKTFEAGKEERILFTYNSFEGLSDLPLPGPVFIHKDSCETYNSSQFPPDLAGLSLLFEGFGENSELVKREIVDKERPESQIEEMFEVRDIRFINIRNAEAGCFIARIEKA
jgi:hypothetical protein